MSNVEANRRCWLMVVAISLLIVPIVGRASDSASTERPNIVFILADDLGYADIEPYGAAKIETPHLQQLAEQGMRFTQMHNTSKCFPSRATLLTGVYAQQCDMWQDHGEIDHAVTLGRVLQKAGYRTIAVGKHHGDENLYHRGFDHYYGLRDGASNYFNPGKQRPSDPGQPAHKEWAYPPGRVFCFDDKTVKGWTPEDDDFYMTDNYTDWSIDLLSKYGGESRPFFLYLSYTAPHDPLQAWPEDIKKYEGAFDEGFAAIRKQRYTRQLEMGLLDRDTFPLSKKTHRDWDALSEKEKEDQARRMEVYAAMIDRMDQNIGRLIDYLKQRGELDNTLIIFASDNGASSQVVKIGDGPIGSMTRWASLKKDWANVGNTPFRYYKTWSYAGGTCTPFIVRGPGLVKAGAITDYVCHFVDIMPTLLEVAGASYPQTHEGRPLAALPGQSLLPVLKGKTQAKRPGPLFWQWSDGKAVYQDGWKLVKEGDRPWQLFHLRQDRSETNNLAQQYPQRRNRLKEQWQRWWASTETYRKN
jgi:arylsulfatase